MLSGKKILLIISGGIAAYKSLELIRLIRKDGGEVECILTAGGAQFVTPLSVAALSGHEAHTELWSLREEADMRHIRLSREADLIVVAPASANILAGMANGLAGDLALTTLLAADKPVLVAPAMNHKMWDHPATAENMRKLAARGVQSAGPCEGEMACNEFGMGRMAEPEAILNAIRAHFAARQSLAGLKALVTAGPTYEPLDPVRFIGNRSSGRQGHAVAAALRERGADVTLVTGPVSLPAPHGVRTRRVETAEEMLAACKDALPCDIAVCAAAVSDWSAEAVAAHKIKKARGQKPPSLALKENPDILAILSKGALRPALVVGFAAETENLVDNAGAKRLSKGCDWIVANNVGEIAYEGRSVFGAGENQVYLVTADGAEKWDRAPKSDIAARLCDRIAERFKARDRNGAPLAAE